ncbi:Rubrerythrin [Desulfacinum hydrothermale DSM 13146]|uniref:Rubrerythrin n=1 Tax=Desulfacinum hydrothermale DSM 13146 TaxID=1121390 RepID=A0A1W1XUB8_9BACT|nr:ferritin family protein [Desulfacinum hydrothermale]SMC27486.1 Rubrerythrin [Desulfacinum hydrothermale DSM 13146]
MFSAWEVLKIAIKLEENGENYYRKAAALQKDPALIQVLEGLAEDEAKHKKWFRQFQDRLQEEPEDRWVQEISGDLLQSMVGDQSFSLQEVDPAELDTMEKILATAIEFEKDTILFYDMLRGFMDEGESANALRQIIEEERLHVEVLEARRAALQTSPA